MDTVGVNDSGQRRGYGLWALGAAAFLLVAASAWWFLTWHVPADREREVAIWRDRLTATADDRRFALDQWLASGLGDARTVARFPTVQFLLDGHESSSVPFPRDLGALGHLGELFEGTMREQGYRGAALVSAGGAVVQAIGGDAGLRGPPARAAAARAIREGVSFVDAFRRADGSLGLLFAAPAASRPDGPAAGAVVLEADPEAFLLPLLRTEPTASRTGEILLARREAEQAVFIAPPGRGHGALGLRRPLGEARFTMRAALEGEETFGEFLDRDAVPVLAATRRLNTVPWGLVVKLDLAEALATHHDRTRAQRDAGALLLLTAVALGVALLRWRAAERVAHINADRARTALLLDQANDAILFVGADGRVRDCNRRAEELYGMPRAALAGRPVVELHAEEERGRAPQDLAAGLSGSIRVETVHVRSDGSRVPVEVSSRAVALDGATTLVSVVRDVSERKLADAQLRRLNRLYRTLSEVDQLIVRGAGRSALFEGVCRILTEEGGFPLAWLGLRQPDGSVGVAARSGVAASFLDDAEVRWDDTSLGQGPAGRTLRTGSATVVPDLLAEPSFAPWSDNAREHGLTGAAAFPVVVGADAIGVLLVYGSAPGELGVQECRLVADLAADVGFALEALAGAEARRSLEEKLRAIFLGDLVGILFGDVHGRVFDANDAFLATIGYSRQDLGRGELRWDAITPPEHLPRDAQAVAEARERGSCTPYEKEYVRKDGSRVWVLVAFVLLEPERERSVALILDIADRKRAEAALREAEEQFLHAQKMEAVGRLAGGVAHDFNNLLGVITGYAEMALRQLDADHRARPRLAEVLKAAERASGLTRQLLAFSRRQTLRPRIVDLNLLIADLEKMLLRLIGEDVELQVRLGPGIGAVRVDPGQIEQVVMNLAVNARDAMPAGGRLTIETEECDAEVLRQQARWEVPPGRYVRLHLSDTGEGMDEAVQARLFEPFFTTKPSGVGTGLGLATVLGIVKQSGGHVFVESAPGRGSRFTVCLPRVEEEAAPRTADAAPRPPGGGETVLLVEDQEALREVAREMLVDLGYRVLPAADADGALALARQHGGEIHLLLTDVVLPGVSGPELAARIAAARPATRVLLMSGYTADVLRRQGLAAQGTPLLDKPFTQESLARMVREVLDRAA